MPSRIIAVVGIAAFCAVSPAYAQQQTTGENTMQADTGSAEEEQRSDPEGSSFIHKARRWAKETQIVERLSGEVDGWYPRLGGMTRGSGFAIGPGYRTHLFDDHILVDLSAGISTKTYKAADARVRWLQALNKRAEIWTEFRYEDFPQEDFFGMGFSSALDTRTSYGFDSTDVVVRGLVTPLPWLRAGTTIGYLRPNIDRGTDDRFPSIEELFTGTEAPGLVNQPNFLHTTCFGEVDYRDVEGRPGKGGLYRFSVGIWNDRTLQQFDFKRFDATAVQYVPLDADKTHVLSGRIGTSYVNNETGHRVPFYFLAYVGGVDTVRSFVEFRFKDENALWVGAEYRWRLIKNLSVVTFVDAGEVSSDWRDLDLSGLKTGYGFGFRVHTSKMTFARIDVGFGGGEGARAFLTLGPRF